MKRRKTADVVMHDALIQGTGGWGIAGGSTAGFSRWRLNAAALVAAVICLVFASTQLASAQTVEGFELTIPLDTVAYIPYDSHRVLATEPVPAQFAGQSCEVTGISHNQESAHPDNDLWVDSGTSRVILHNVEDEPGTVVEASGTLVLGSEVIVTLHMGPDAVFSAGLDVVIDCAQVSGTTTTVAPTTTIAATTTSQVAGTTVAPEPTTTVDDEVLGTVITSSTVADEVEDLEVLPFTGSRDAALVFVAAGLLAVGGLLVVASRRQES